MPDPACWVVVGECEGLAWPNEAPSKGLVTMQKGNFLRREAMPRLGGYLRVLSLSVGEVVVLYLGELIVMAGGCRVACEPVVWLMEGTRWGLV